MWREAATSFLVRRVLSTREAVVYVVLSFLLAVVAPPLDSTITTVDLADEWAPTIFSEADGLPSLPSTSLGELASIVKTPPPNPGGQDR